MKKMLKNRKGLSTVVTTLIILVVSVLLATVVTYYAINVTSTRVVEESIDITKAHIWASASDAQAGFMIINRGGRDVVIDKITVRGQECTWDKVYYCVTDDSIVDDLYYISGTIDTVTLDNSTTQDVDYDLTQGTAGNDIVVPSGYTMIVYIDDPDSISVNDVGTTVSIVVYTAQAQYYEECNVEAAS